MRILLRVAYDGTAYSGWQIQPNAITVEEILNKAINDLFGHSVTVIGASRTDAGVHAMGNVAVFDIDTRIPAEKISYALNARLPDDIRVQQSIEVPGGFHPRHTDCIKTYEYRIWNSSFENPSMRLYTHFCYGNIDVIKMQEAAKHIVGTYDFTSFCSTGSQVEDKVRTVYSLDIDKKNELITIRITGNGFLYNMVRIIAGTLLRVGQGYIEPQKVPSIIEGRNRQLAGPTAPARGLSLIKIRYTELGE